MCDGDQTAEAMSAGISRSDSFQPIGLASASFVGAELAEDVVDCYDGEDTIMMDKIDDPYAGGSEVVGDSDKKEIRATTGDVESESTGVSRSKESYPAILKIEFVKETAPPVTWKFNSLKSLIWGESIFP